MPRKTFWLFVAPSLTAMLLLIALPLLLVLGQSFFITQEMIETRVQQTCDPFGCKEETVQIPQRAADGSIITRTRWVGLSNYRDLLQPEQIAQAWKDRTLVQTLSNIDFYRALRFTLTFAFITLPLVLLVGFALALAVNRTSERLRGYIIFFSLLPFIITPVIGALSIRWLFIGDGILTAMLERLLARDLALFANGWVVEGLMLFYRIWHVAPFAFVVFYAGLQTVNRDALEAALIDGATRWQRLRYVIIPHLMPLIVFVSLIHLMDAYRVFEEIVGFSAQAHRISLQWMTFDLLQPDDTGNRAIARASAAAMLTMIGIVLILMPILHRTWKDYQR
ncbi:MAG: carbohydrate ABC transporter permease [Gammaproteobacteria bacterium]